MSSKFTLICAVFLIAFSFGIGAILVVKLYERRDDIRAETKIDAWGLHLKTDSVIIGLVALVLVGVYLLLRQRNPRRLRPFFRRDRKRQILNRSSPTALPALQNIPAPPHQGPEKDYEIVNRLITTEFLTRTLCKCSHEVTVRAITDKPLEVYDGRYPRFDKNEQMTIHPPHKLLKLHPESGGWIPFDIKLGQPLTKGKSTLIKMNFQWLSETYQTAPDCYMVVFCKTDTITFVTIFPSDLRIVDPVGEIFHHFGEQALISSVSLEYKDNTVAWNIPQIAKYLHYRIRWKWA